MRTFHVLKAKPGTRAADVIVPRSGIVTDPTWDEDTDKVLVYYEGNIYGAANLQAFEDRVLVAAGRLAESSTMARGLFPRTDFEVIGTFTFSPDWQTKTLSLNEPM